MDEGALRGALQALGVELPPTAPDTLAAHARAVVTANATLNLTRITDPERVAVEHVADSLACLLVLDELLAAERAPRLVDVGSGAGYPGIPLAVARPGWRVTLVEARRKKARFLARLVAELGLTNAEVTTGRAESLGREPAFRECFAAAVARAVAPLPVLAELLLPLVAVGGAAVAMKSAGHSDELEKGRRAAGQLGAALAEPVPYMLPGVGRRVLVVLRKTAATPPDLPRRPGMPAKRPLA